MIYDEKKSVFSQFETRNDFIKLLNAVKGYYSDLNALQGVISDYCLTHNGEPITDAAIAELNVWAEWTRCAILRYEPSDHAFYISHKPTTIKVTGSSMQIEQICPQFTTLRGYYFAPSDNYDVRVFDYDTCVIADDVLRDKASVIIANLEYVADNWDSLLAKVDAYCEIAHTLLKGLHPLCVSESELPLGIVPDVRAWCKAGRIVCTDEINKGYDELLNNMHDESENN